MRPLRSRMHGMTSFAGELEIDHSALPSGLIALAGPNGAGKTSLMDSFAMMPIYRAFSSRTGTLKDGAVARDAFIEAEIAYAGRVYRHLLTIDPGPSKESVGKMKAYLFEDGVPLGEDGSDGNTTPYDEMVCRGPNAIYPSEAVFRASAHASQSRTGNFLTLTVPKRKELFRTLLGLDYLQDLADRAGRGLAPLDAASKRLDEEAAVLAATRTTHAELTERVATLEFTLATEATPSVTAAELAHGAAVQTLSGLRATLDQLLTGRRAAEERIAEIDRESATCDADATRSKQRATELRSIIADEVAIKDRAAALSTALSDQKHQAAEWRAAHEATKARSVAHDSAVSDRDRATSDATRHRTSIAATATARNAIPDLERRLSPLAGHRAEEKRLGSEIREKDPTARMKRRDADADVSAAEILRREAVAAIAAAEGKAALLDGVPCGGTTLYEKGGDDQFLSMLTNARDCGSCRFLTDARTGRDALPELRAKFERAASMRAAADVKRAEADLLTEEVDKLTEARDLAAKAIEKLLVPEAELARLRVVVAAGAPSEVALEEVEARMPALEAAVVSAATALEEARKAEAVVVSSGTSASTRVKDLAGADDRLRALEAAIVQLPLVEAEVERATGRSAQLAVSRAAVVIPPLPEAQQAAVGVAQAQVAVAETALREARTALQELRTSIDQLRGRLAQLGDVGAKTAALEERRERIARRRVGFVLVEAGFGSQGIQALEIDAAGPEVSGLCNQLLEAGGGPPLTVNLRTVQPAEKGRIQKEVFDIAIHDGRSDGGRTPGVRTFDWLSGGEQVWVDLSLKLAISVFNSRRAGSQCLTMFLDEAEKGLDETLCLGFPAMLRAAIQLAGLDRIYFISHRESVWSQADAILTVANGRVEVGS